MAKRDFNSGEKFVQTKRSKVMFSPKKNKTANGYSKMVIDNKIKVDTHQNRDLFLLSILGTLDELRTSHRGIDTDHKFDRSNDGNTTFRYSLNATGKKKLDTLRKKRIKK